MTTQTNSPGASGPARPESHRGWWIYPAWFFAILQLLCYLIPRSRPGITGAILWGLGADRIIWPAIALLLVLLDLVWAAGQRPFWSRSRAVAFGLLAALFFSPLAFRVYPSSHDHEISAVPFRLPLDGPVTVGWGGSTPAVNYHVRSADQRWAYDLLVSKDGARHSGSGAVCADYYIYGLPLLAAADGTVRLVTDGEPDAPVGDPSGYQNSGGNQIVIEVAPDQFLHLCHLQPGSISVKAGDRVRQGQAIARIGNSGHTSEPHLHIHLQDTPDPDFGEGIPLYFHRYRVNGRVVDRGIPTGGIDLQGRCTGPIVENVDP